MRLPAYDYAEIGAYFVTICTRIRGQDILGRPLPDIVGRLKSYTDRQYRLLGTPFGPKLWQRSYYDHVIRGEYDVQNARQYILNNPQKWIQDKEP